MIGLTVPAVAFGDSDSTKVAELKEIVVEGDT